MKLLALCVIFVTLQYVLSTNYISGFHNHDWICDYELDTLNDIEVKPPKRSVEDKNKNNTNKITMKQKIVLMMKMTYMQGVVRELL
ncbi:unnamed protein product [Chrysodeixis includens]|uniref:Uncharacterized protein n=1 Tax=Chrysodeixis includens TaxID=689277 RepID=A0A9P0BXH3_CHRIL|nr:unnamed protein product [Chrysodeixis includens]